MNRYEQIKAQLEIFTRRSQYPSYHIWNKESQQLYSVFILCTSFKGLSPIVHESDDCS